VLLTLSLSSDSAVDTDDYNPRAHLPILDKYDYVMCGKVYRVHEEGTKNWIVNISFGGLLMSIKAESRVLTRFALDNTVYLLLKRK
jgi:DNA-directed RNA polymerases I, II, and III subunit RPABC3